VIAAPPRRALQVLRERLGDDRVQLFGDRLHVRVDREEGQHEVIARLRSAGIPPTGVRTILPTLEDVFIELLASAGAARA
jgi:ABC-2 type transport system ATP-binding protein